MQGKMRDRILAAAVSVMRERGVAGTTTKEVARTAGVAEGSIYNHFANKTELIGACMAEVAGGIRDALTRLSGRAGQGTVEDNLTELAEAEIAFFTDFLPVAGPILGDHDLREWLRQGGPGTAPGGPPSRRQDVRDPHQSPATYDAPPARVPDATPPPSAQSGGVPPDTHGGEVSLGAQSDGVPPGAHGSGVPPSAQGGGIAPDPQGSAVPPGTQGGGVPPGAQSDAVPSGAHGSGVPPGPVIGHAVVIGYLEAERLAGRLAVEAPAAYLAVSLIGACQQYAFVRLLTSPEAMTGLAGLPEDPAAYARQVVRTVLAGHLTQSPHTPHLE